MGLGCCPHSAADALIEVCQINTGAYFAVSFWYIDHSNTLFSWFIYLGNDLHLFHPGKFFFDLSRKGFGYSPWGTEYVRFGIRFQLYDVNRASTFSNPVKSPGNVGLWIPQNQSFFYYSKSFDSWTTKRGVAGNISYKYLLLCCFASFVDFSHKTSTQWEGRSMRRTKQCLGWFYEGWSR